MKLRVKNTFIIFVIGMLFLQSYSAFSINGTPLKIEILNDGKINFFYNNVDEVFKDDCVISVKYFLNETKRYGHRISSLGQNLGNPFEVLERSNESISLKAGNLTINQKVIYINGTDFFTIEWNITNTANESIKNISFFHGADTAVAGTDYYDKGIYNSNNKALYAKDAKNPNYVVGLVPLPNFIPDEFDIDHYKNVWNHILKGKLSNKTSYWGDPAIAFGWRKKELKANESWIIKVNWKFNEDNKIPEINYSIDPRINFVNESFNIRANASEFVLWQIKIFNGTSILFYYNSSGNSTSLSWNYSKSGNFTVEIIATDNAGNTKIANDSIKIIQRQQLFLNVTKPLNNTITNNKTIIVEGFTNALNVSINRFIANVSNGSFSFALNLTEGNNTINITARDSLGNKNSTTLSVILDTKIPLTILEPLNNTITNNRTILIKGITKTNVNVSIDGNSMIASNGSFSFYFNLNEGNNTINITARDSLGNKNSTTLSVILDTVPPKIKWINYSNNIKIYKTFRFALNITDNVNLTYVSANTKVDDRTKNLFVYYVDGYYIVNVKPKRIGDWILNIRACDSAGNCNKSSFSYYVYSETEEERPKAPILPSNKPKNVIRNENKTENKTLKNQTVIYTHGNLTTTLSAPKTVLENISGTIYATPTEKGIKFEANGKVLKNFEFYVNGTKIKTNEDGYVVDEKSKYVFWDSLRESYEKRLKEMEKSKINSSVDLKNTVKRNTTTKTIERSETGRITNQNFENIKEGKIFETEVRDSNGNLIRNKEVEITLPNGERIRVKTDENGKVKLMQKHGKIAQVNPIPVKISEIKENKEYEIEVKDEEGNLIKNKNVSVLLPNGQILNVITDENGKAKVEFKNGRFETVEEKERFDFHWYYLLSLFLIPLLLYLVLKEDAILSYEFYKKLKEENRLNELKKYRKIYMLKKYENKVQDLNVIFIDSESEEQLAKELRLKILK